MFRHHEMQVFYIDKGKTEFSYRLIKLLKCFNIQSTELKSSVL